MSRELKLTVTGMTCGGCEAAVTRALSSMEGVQNVAASHAANEVTLQYDPARATPEQIAARIEKLGYTPHTSGSPANG